MEFQLKMNYKSIRWNNLTIHCLLHISYMKRILNFLTLKIPVINDSLKLLFDIFNKIFYAIKSVKIIQIYIKELSLVLYLEFIVSNSINENIINVASFFYFILILLGRNKYNLKSFIDLIGIQTIFFSFILIIIINVLLT